MGDRIELRVLGATSILVGDEPQVTTGRASLLLSLLATRLNTVVGSHALADAIWPDGASRTALHQLVSRVRKVLGRTGSVRLETTAVGYRLAAPPQAVDLTRLEAEVSLGRAEMIAGRPGEAEAAFRRAVDLWAEPFGRWADHEDLVSDANRLRELQASVEEELSDAVLARHDGNEEIERFQRAVDEAPLRERRWCQLMTALYRAGRQSDALRAAQVARRHLAEEIGVAPGTELLALEAAILAHAPELGVGPRPRPEFRLPADVTSFIGREAECAQLGRLIEGHRLVTVCGPGGGGKSRIALRVARDRAAGLRDGAVYVELSELTDLESVASALVRAMGVTWEDRHDVATVVGQLAGLECLVVLDNCEGVVGPVAMVVERMVTACPEVSVVVTSQYPLGILGEARWRVPAMSTVGAEGPSDAEALFMERALGDGRSPWTGGDIVTLCERLDGMPLAIELAAGLTPALSPKEIVDRLDERFELLALDRETTPRHHRSLQAMLAWSCRLLSAPASALLDRLSTFAGDFTMEGATAIGAGGAQADPSVVSLLNELVSRSLIDTTSTPGGTRYQLPESVRLFAARRLVERGRGGGVIELDADDAGPTGTSTRAGHTRN